MSAGSRTHSASRTFSGSVRRAGSRIRVMAQLINAQDGYHLWSERYDRELTDIFAIQDDIAQSYNWPEAAREFQLAMASPSMRAEAHWARASFLMQPFGRFEESSAEMRRAVEKDPLSVLWRGVLAANLVLAGKYEHALQEGSKGLDISENEIHPHLAFAEAYLALGRVAEAVASAETAHRNLPGQSMGTGLLAACLVRQGEKDRAATLILEMGGSPTPI
jgi:tetratricopeptide (TPR) repeat protein